MVEWSYQRSELVHNYFLKPRFESYVSHKQINTTYRNTYEAFYKKQRMLPSSCACITSIIQTVVILKCVKTILKYMLIVWRRSWGIEPALCKTLSVPMQYDHVIMRDLGQNQTYFLSSDNAATLPNGQIMLVWVRIPCTSNIFF